MTTTLLPGAARRRASTRSQPRALAREMVPPDPAPDVLGFLWSVFVVLTVVAFVTQLRVGGAGVAWAAEHSIFTGPNRAESG
jgi:hypothetical protein